VTNLRARSDIYEDRLILCEGAHDRAFLEALHQDRELPGAQITCPSNHNLPPGKDGFGGFLTAIQGWTSFPRLKELVIVADSDDNPAKAFQDVVAEIGKAAAYPLPTVPHTKIPGPPSVAVIMIPWHNKPGALETLCFEAAARAFPAQAACVDQLASCTGADQWPTQKLAKMRLRALVATTFRKRPDVSLGYIWTQAPNLVPISDVVFDGVADVLRHL
jgi:hypothetical protein